MKRFLRSTVPVFAAATVAGLLCSCYHPTPFVPPTPPYQFPAASEIATFLGATNTNFKIAYALSNNGPRDIYYVDFNNSAPAPKVLIKPAGNESFDADKPLLSPDGTFVTYGLLQGNTVLGAYIQKLDTTAEPVLIAAKGARPHWYQASKDSLFIIYSTVYLIEGTGVIDTSIGKTYRQLVSLAGAGSATGSPAQIAPYPMNGGLSRDGAYLCTGYQPGSFYNLPDSTLIPINKGVQICNPSIDPDSVTTDRMMFLNIGGIQNLINPFARDSAFPGRGNLPEHSVIFIVDASNTVINFIPFSIMSAIGVKDSAWQCPQWSNNPGYAATLASSNDNNTAWDLLLIKNVGIRGKEIPLLMTLGSGKMNTNSTPSLWIGN